MQFNAAKCNVMSINPNPKHHSSRLYTIKGEILKEVETITYLGIQISNDLSWDKHIAHITGKANSTLGFLKRNLKFCPESTKRTAYLALVKSKLSYACSIWDPHLRRHIDMIEKVQHKSVRFILSDYTSKKDGDMRSMLSTVNLEPLHECRKQSRLSFLDKIKSNQFPAIKPEDYFTQARVNRRRIIPRVLHDKTQLEPIRGVIHNNDHGLNRLEARTTVRLNSYIVKTVDDWNRLSNEEVLGIMATVAPKSSTVEDH